MKTSNFDARPKNIFKSKTIHLLTLSFSDCWIYIENKQLCKKRAVFDKIKERKPLQHNYIVFAQFWEHLLILEPWNPDIQESWNPLDLAWFGRFQHIGCFSYSNFVKELDFQPEIQKFHHSWNLPGTTWNSGMPLELANSLPNLIYWVSIQLNFCH